MSIAQIAERSLGIKAYPFKSRDDSNPEQMDMPNAMDLDDDYITHSPLTLGEQDTPEKEIKTQAKPEDIAPDESMPVKMDNEEPPAQGGGMPAGAPQGMEGGMPGEMPLSDAPETPEEVGRVYELKKVFSRLVSMETFLSSNSDPSVVHIRNYVSRAIDLFRTLISNLDLYKDRLDEIVITFYKFVDKVYTMLAAYYKTGNASEIESIE